MNHIKRFRLPRMLLRIYSLIVLALDLFTLQIGIWFSILLAIYRTFKPPPLKSLHGEVAMVIGAGHGLGREIALELSRLGVTVACVDIDIETCSVTVLRASQLSGIAKLFICDVTDKNQVAQTVNAIQQELGEITMLFHCCGVPSPRTLLDAPLDVKSTFDISVLSHFLLIDSILPRMVKLKRGHIVILSSVAGLSGGMSRASKIPFTAAQFAVQGLAESLQTEFRHSNTNVLVSLVHIYPFIIGSEETKDIRLRIPSYFGTISAVEAAKRILDGVRRNYAEFSVPGYLLYLGHVLRILPKRASFMLRDLLDTGVDFA